MKHLKTIGILVLALYLTCGVARAQNQSLFERLGEQPGIALLMDHFIWELKSDGRVAWQFKNTDWSRFKKSMVDLVTTISGGPKVYKGPSMKEIHARMRITDADFNAVVEDFVKAENRVGIGKWEQKQLARALLATRKDVVTVHHKRK